MRFKEVYQNKTDPEKKRKRMIGNKGMQKKTLNKTEKYGSKKEMEIKNKSK